jgi:hypothetical protein
MPTGIGHREGRDVRAHNAEGIPTDEGYFLSFSPRGSLMLWRRLV